MTLHRRTRCLYECSHTIWAAALPMGTSSCRAHLVIAIVLVIRDMAYTLASCSSIISFRFSGRAPHSHQTPFSQYCGAARPACRAPALRLAFEALRAEVVVHTTHDALTHLIRRPHYVARLSLLLLCAMQADVQVWMAFAHNRRRVAVTRCRLGYGPPWMRGIGPCVR